ncbi:uncharacterized protein LOC103024580 isoform X1 [Astyanax mexicanus]|uniref:uncharacterized protein LOC103024580 isoform X1 n=1 Tax=Astyanax mexicanus TaxID=7994 RepID=UPI0020CAD753|nr:uncharacterized protein LOC103024580 isoform X1 [Astyanax mexicanus]
MDGSDDGSGSEPDSFGCRSGNRAGEGGEWQVVRSKKSRRLSEDRDSSGSEVRGETVKRRKDEYLILIQFESESAGVLNPVRLTSEIKSALGDVAGAKVLRGVGGGNAPSVGLPSAINLKEEEEEERRRKLRCYRLNVARFKLLNSGEAECV